MIRLLLCGTNYDAVWAADTLSGILHSDMKTAILPLYEDLGYASDAAEWNERFRDEGVFTYDLLRPLRSYGIPKQNVRILDHFRLEGWDPEQYDLIVLVGDDPFVCAERLEDLGLTESLVHYRGVLMGLSGGASVLCERFFRRDEDGYPAEGRGLGLVKNVQVDMHHLPDEAHIRLLIQMLETVDDPVVCIPEEGGLLVQEGEYLMFGDAFALTDRDLDRLYEQSTYLASF